MGKMPGISVFYKRKMFILYNNADWKKEKTVVSYSHKEEMQKANLQNLKDTWKSKIQHLRASRWKGQEEKKNEIGREMKGI